MDGKKRNEVRSRSGATAAMMNTQVPWRATAYAKVVLVVLAYVVLIGVGWALRSIIHWSELFTTVAPPPIGGLPHCELGFTLHVENGMATFRQPAVVCQNPGAGWVVVSR